MRHPLAGPEFPTRDGIIVGFAAPAEHAFARAVEALCAVLRASGLAKSALR
jgi:GntR family transcriptional regulator/MocR family aminotransferase